MRKLIHILTMLAFVFSCGGQWYALQAVAWVQMVQDYARIVPITQAVEMTLSGKYPCALCKLVAEKKQSDNLKMGNSEKLKKIVFAFRLPKQIQHRTPIEPFSSLSVILFTRTETPPVPPPRFA